MMKTLLIPFLALFPLSATAQSYTTAAEVRPILEMTRANWIAVRNFDGRDLIYFSNPLSWRCGLTAIRYSVNGETEVHDLPMEPCYEGEANPNNLKFDKGTEVYITLPPDSVKSVHVVMAMDDGSEMIGDYERAAVQIN